MSDTEDEDEDAPSLLWWQQQLALQLRPGRADAANAADAPALAAEADGKA